ncbi:WG repeat-containing protein [Chryseobacterium hagamense]|uniref:WG repeat-containing protein n=1 Tax=Chryseobacterium hagamense TaxID=395935 RepID=A0A511YNP0_9FLAO|nr:WG repeat-containing protein [Chryseobacterium hagamense]GEN76807.1 hypothetical protein CHA01nite_25470 [Chryseobacterium hagamense]
MKNLFFFAVVLFQTTLYGQSNYQKYSHKNIIVKGDFLKNKFSDRYLLIGDFMPIEENSQKKAAKVFTSNGWGYIDENGHEIIPTIYESISDFRHGLVSAKIKVPLPSQDGIKRLEIRNEILNYSGKKLIDNNGFVQDFSNSYYYQKDFFVAFQGNNQGVMTNLGKVLVPFKYEQIDCSNNFFFAYLKSSKGDNYRTVDIYSKNGTLLKSLVNYGIGNCDGHLTASEYYDNGENFGSFFIDNKTFEPLDNRRFSTINNVENSNLFKITVSFENKKDDTYPSFYLDKNLKIISPDFPDTYICDDKFLVQPIPVGKNPDHATSFAIIDFKNNKIAEYSYEDFMLYQYFAYGRLDDPKFLESQKNYWKQLQKYQYSEYFYVNKWDYFKNLERREHFSKFFEVDASGKEISSGFVDATTGRICIKRNLDEVAYVGNIIGTDFFQVKYKNTVNGDKFDIYDSYGKFVRSDFGNYINTDFDILNKHTPDYYILDKGKDTIFSQRLNFQQLLNRQTMEPVFKNQLMYFADPHYLYSYGVMTFTDFKTKKTGIIDKNYNIRIMGDYDIIRSFYTKDNTNRGYSIIYLKTKSNTIEIIKNNTFEHLLKIEFEPGILKNYGDKDKYGKEITSDAIILGQYKNGFYLINEEQKVIDRYGNIIDTPENFSLND